MKRILFILLLILSDVYLFSQSPERIKIEEIVSDFSHLATAYPRTEGSEQERKTVEYFISRIPAVKSISIKNHDFTETDTGHSFSRIVEVTIPGVREDTLVIAVPLDHRDRIPMERSGALNIALALGIIRTYAEEKPPVTLKILLLGADDGDSATMGSEYFLKNYYPDSPVSVLYLDFEAIPSRIIFESGGRGRIAPYWLLERYASSVKSTQLPFLNLGNENQAFRIGLSPKRSPLGEYLANGYPGIALKGRYNAERTLSNREWISGFMDFFHAFLNREQRRFHNRVGQALSVFSGTFGLHHRK